MFGRPPASSDNIQYLKQVEEWTRASFHLDPSELVLVNQDHPSGPGYPPLSTTVLFWRDGRRYRFTLFKPPSEVLKSDIPLGWLAPGLLDEGEDCC